MSRRVGDFRDFIAEVTDATDEALGDYRQAVDLDGRRHADPGAARDVVMMHADGDDSEQEFVPATQSESDELDGGPCTAADFVAASRRLGVGSTQVDRAHLAIGATTHDACNASQPLHFTWIGPDGDLCRLSNSGSSNSNDQTCSWLLSSWRHAGISSSVGSLNLSSEPEADSPPVLLSVDLPQCEQVVHCSSQWDEHLGRHCSFLVTCGKGHAGRKARTSVWRVADSAPVRSSAANASGPCASQLQRVVTVPGVVHSSAHVLLGDGPTLLVPSADDGSLLLASRSVNCIKPSSPSISTAPVGRDTDTGLAVPHRAPGTPPNGSAHAALPAVLLRICMTAPLGACLGQPLTCSTSCDCWLLSYALHEGPISTATRRRMPTGLLQMQIRRSDGTITLAAALCDAGHSVSCACPVAGSAGGAASVEWLVGCQDGFVQRVALSSSIEAAHAPPAAAAMQRPSHQLQGAAVLMHSLPRVQLAGNSCDGGTGRWDKAVVAVAHDLFAARVTLLHAVSLEPLASFAGVQCCLAVPPGAAWLSVRPASSCGVTAQLVTPALLLLGGSRHGGADQHSRVEALQMLSGPAGCCVSVATALGTALAVPHQVQEDVPFVSSGALGKALPAADVAGLQGVLVSLLDRCHEAELACHALAAHKSRMHELQQATVATLARRAATRWQNTCAFASLPAWRASRTALPAGINAQPAQPAPLSAAAAAAAAVAAPACVRPALPADPRACSLVTESSCRNASAATFTGLTSAIVSVQRSCVADQVVVMLHVQLSNMLRAAGADGAGRLRHSNTGSAALTQLLASSVGPQVTAAELLFVQPDGSSISGCSRWAVSETAAIADTADSGSAAGALGHGRRVDAPSHQADTSTGGVLICIETSMSMHELWAIARLQQQQQQQQRRDGSPGSSHHHPHSHQREPQGQRSGEEAPQHRTVSAAGTLRQPPVRQPAPGGGQRLGVSLHGCCVITTVEGACTSTCRLACRDRQAAAASPGPHVTVLDVGLLQVDVSSWLWAFLMDQPGTTLLPHCPPHVSGGEGRRGELGIGLAEASLHFPAAQQPCPQAGQLVACTGRSLLVHHRTRAEAAESADDVDGSKRTAAAHVPRPLLDVLRSAWGFGSMQQQQQRSTAAACAAGSGGPGVPGQARQHDRAGRSDGSSRMTLARPAAAMGRTAAPGGAVIGGPLVHLVDHGGHCTEVCLEGLASDIDFLQQQVELAIRGGYRGGYQDIDVVSHHPSGIDSEALEACEDAVQALSALLDSQVQHLETSLLMLHAAEQSCNALTDALPVSVLLAGSSHGAVTGLAGGHHRTAAVTALAAHVAPIIGSYQGHLTHWSHCGAPVSESSRVGAEAETPQHQQLPAICNDSRCQRSSVCREWLQLQLSLDSAMLRLN